MTYSNDEAIEMVVNENWTTVFFIRRFNVVHDPNYGSDADGRRGVHKTFIEDDMADNIVVGDKPIASFPTSVQQEIYEKVYGWMNQNDPEWDEDNGY